MFGFIDIVVRLYTNILEYVKATGDYSFGYWMMITTIMVTAFYLVYKVAKKDIILQLLKFINKKNKTLDDYRREITPKIYNYLDKSMLDIYADRAFIFEYHNGTTSLLGLPFLYADITYERYREGVEPCIDEFNRLNLSKYPIFEYLYKNKSWKGTVKELSQIDPRLAKRFEVEDIDYLYMLQLPKDGVGCIVYIYNKNDFTPHVEPEDVMRVITTSALSITDLLADEEILKLKR